MVWYTKNMLSENSMFDDDESANESDSLGEDPIASNELNEDEVKYDPFEFPHDDEIPFSILLFDSIIWQVQRSNNGDANLNVPLLNDVQTSNAPRLPPPMLYTLQSPQVKTHRCNQQVPWKWTP
jgi:hypothetical protein